MKMLAARCAVLMCISLMFLIPSCAPKKVRIYDMPEGARSDLVQIALAQQGKKYRSGAKGPDYFDCSGLVYFTYRQAGISVPLTAEAQGRYGAEISRGETQPGTSFSSGSRTTTISGLWSTALISFTLPNRGGWPSTPWKSTYWRRY